MLFACSFLLPKVKYYVDWLIWQFQWVPQTSPAAAALKQRARVASLQYGRSLASGDVTLPHGVDSAVQKKEADWPAWRAPNQRR